MYLHVRRKNQAMIRLNLKCQDPLPLSLRTIKSCFLFFIIFYFSTTWLFISLYWFLFVSLWYFYLFIFSCVCACEIARVYVSRALKIHFIHLFFFFVHFLWWSKFTQRLLSLSFAPQCICRFHSFSSFL